MLFQFFDSRDVVSQLEAVPILVPTTLADPTDARISRPSDNGTVSPRCFAVTRPPC